MGIDYNKYINSKGTHYIANSGSDENGAYHGGKVGDQTGREWQLKAWYNRPWSCVLRHPDPRVRRLIAEFGIEAALNDLIGYDQYQRTTFWAALKVAAGYRPANITTACEADCTAGVAAIVKAVGYALNMAKLQGVSIDAYSGNLKAVLKAAGFEVITESKYRTGHAYLLPGDVLLYEGHHAAINITRGSRATGEVADHVDTGDSTPSSTSGGNALGSRILKKGAIGADVRELQIALIALGYSCGSDGADGDYGSNTVAAVKKFQQDKGLLVDGEAGPDTIGALNAALAAQKPAADKPAAPAAPETPAQPTTGKRVVIFNCKSANIRSGPGDTCEIVGTCAPGNVYAAVDGWTPVLIDGQVRWISSKYARVEG